MIQSFLVSPGVNVTEYDLSQIVSSVATSDAAVAGVFEWGPVNQIQLIGSEVELAAQYSTPTNFNPETWFTGANFLGYGQRLHVCRAGDMAGNTWQVGNTSTGIVANSGIITGVNTANLAVGMLLFYDSSGSLNYNPKVEFSIVSILSGTSLQVSGPASQNATGANLIFRDDILYSAVGQEFTEQNIEWAEQIVANNSVYSNVHQNFDESVNWVARWPGTLGNSIGLSQCDTANQYSSNLVIYANSQMNAQTSFMLANIGSNTILFQFASANTANGLAANTQAHQILNDISIGDIIQVGNNSLGFQYLSVTNTTTVSVSGSNTASFTVQLNDNYILGANLINFGPVQRYWQFFNSVGGPPGSSAYQLQYGNNFAADEMHIVIFDTNGDFSSSPGTVLEVYEKVSRANDAVQVDGGTNYYKDILNQQSKYVWAGFDRDLAPTNTAIYLTSSTASAPLTYYLYGGADGPNEANVSMGALLTAWGQFVDPEVIDISLVCQGKARGLGVSSNTQLGTWLIQHLSQKRRDCVTFISPDKNIVVFNQYNEVQDMINARNVMPSSSYGVMDSGYKYQYDQYNDIYRYIPMNGDIAGLCAYTDQIRAPWWSPAGFSRGQINDVIYLAFNPKQADRDLLYPSQINPVVTFPGKGTILYGDKTLYAFDSAFSRINVRRLFIVIEKAISAAAQNYLFEFNDDFTRAQFKAMVNPYLKAIQGQRGIYDFLVVCDASNNPPDVIDANQFIADIYVKPARSINFIQLNFVAVATGVAFTEVVGKFGGTPAVT